MQLNAAQRDRAVGAVLGMATGDALGMGYEFGPPVDPEAVHMKPNPALPLFAPGEWTDDTTMAVPILQELAAGRDLLDQRSQDHVVGGWLEWLAAGPKDIGVSTAFVLAQAHTKDASGVRQSARDRYRAGALCAGNGSLMRTTPIVLGYLDDAVGLARAARAYSELTHADPDATDACVLWNQAQRHAIVHGELDVTVGLPHLIEERRGLWDARLAHAAQGEPSDFAADNGWVVAALQCAWAAIVSAPGDGPEAFGSALRAAVAAGHDADTVAAIAGGLLGARWGASAIPLDWRLRLFGWPGWTGEDMAQAAHAAVGGEPWPAQFHADLAERVEPVRLPCDGGVWLGDAVGLRRLPAEVDAVVSLCRIGGREGPPGITPQNHARVWLIDSARPEDNPNLSLVVDQTVALIQRWRGEGKSVYLHCVHAQSRTPFIAAAYGARITGRPAGEVLQEVVSVLPQADPNRRFRDFLGAPRPGAPGLGDAR